MSAPPDVIQAHVHARTTGECLLVELRGQWKITEARPSWSDTIAGQTPDRVRLALEEVESWDSSLLLFIFEVQQWCKATGATLDERGLPEKMRKLMGQLSSAQPTEVPKDRSTNFFATVGVATGDVWQKTKEITNFVGECTLSALYLLRRPAKFRWRDCLLEMQQCGAMALPIVSLIGLLVGLTMAYTAAVLLRQFGADIYVSDFVGLVMVREMGPMMTAIVLAGRTGAAFAATIANMKANEEIDALETLGIRSVDFLVIPRMLALGVMMPLLVLYSNLLGIVGGVIVAAGLLDIPPAAFWVEMLTAVDLSDLVSGIIKATTFGIIVGLAGCLRGLQSERSAAGVGAAATSAVVTAIVLIIVADAIYAVLFNILGI